MEPSPRLHIYHAGNGVVQMAKNTETKAQPEVLAKFGEAARHDEGKAEKPGLFADRQSAPIPTDPKLKQDAATKVFREGVYHNDQGADEAIKKLPDRILKK
jgi:hypothetical protein